VGYTIRVLDLCAFMIGGLTVTKKTEGLQLHCLSKFVITNLF